MTWLDQKAKIIEKSIFYNVNYANDKMDIGWNSKPTQNFDVLPKARSSLDKMYSICI